MFHNLYSSGWCAFDCSNGDLEEHPICFYGQTASPHPTSQSAWRQCKHLDPYRFLYRFQIFLDENPIGSCPGIYRWILLFSLFDRFSLHLSPAFCGKVESTWSAGAASLTPEHKGSRLTLELKNAVAVSQRNFKGLLQHSMHKSQIFATADFADSFLLKFLSNIHLSIRVPSIVGLPPRLTSFWIIYLLWN